MPTRHAIAPVAQSDTAIPLIAERPEYMAALVPVREIERALDERERLLASMKARRRGEQSKKSASERALALVQGGRLTATPTDDDLERVYEEIALLRAALIEKHAVLDRVAGELAYAESRALKPAFDEFMVDALRAMTALAAAFRGASALAAVLIKAGYRPSAMVLPDITPDSVRLLGDPAIQGTPAWYFAKAVQARKENRT